MSSSLKWSPFLPYFLHVLLTIPSNLYSYCQLFSFIHSLLLRYFSDCSECTYSTNVAALITLFRLLTQLFYQVLFSRHSSELLTLLLPATSGITNSMGQGKRDAWHTLKKEKKRTSLFIATSLWDTVPHLRGRFLISKEQSSQYKSFWKVMVSLIRDRISGGRRVIAWHDTHATSGLLLFVVAVKKATRKLWAELTS